MHLSLFFVANLLVTTASDSKQFSVRPWIIIPILIVAVITAVPIYIARDRRKRRDLKSESSRTTSR